MAKPAKDQLFDLRLVERQLRKGTLSQADLERHLAGLPDTTENSMPLFESKDAKHTGIDN